MNKKNPPELRGRMYAELAGFLYPKRKATEVSGVNDSPLIEPPADPLDVARRVAFLLDKGVRAKAGTLSDTDTDDGETPPPGRIPSTCPPQSRNSTDFQNPPLVKDDVSSELVTSDPENFSENSEPTPLVNEPSGDLINTEDGKAEPPKLEVPRCPLSGVKRT